MKLAKSDVAQLLVGILIVVAAGGAWASRSAWLPLLPDRLAQTDSSTDSQEDDHDHDDHDGHSHDGHDHAEHDHGTPDRGTHSQGAHDHGAHDHEGHDDASALELSTAAWKNIGLRTGVVKTTTFIKTVAVPAVVVERPGRSQVEITAPLTGIVTQVFPIEGEATQPGRPLFTLRLTHEDLVTAQRAFLQTAQELDVLKAEIDRLKSAGEGVIAGRRLLEQQYEMQKMDAALHAQRQGLLLHGLTDQHIDDILRTRQLLQTLTVNAPQFDMDSEHHDVEHVFHIQQIDVKRGQHVTAGTTLGVLADHCLLYVEGQAFEDDAQRLMQAAREGWTVKVSPLRRGSALSETQELQVFYIADHIDTETRALNFYLILENTLVRNEQRGDHTFISWKHRPGQRMEVGVPTDDPWRNQIVLPVEAVVQEGAEAFVFQQNGDHFDRMTVHVLYRDKDVVVLERDDKLIGSRVAMSGAYQMQLALKNKASGGNVGHGHMH